MICTAPTARFFVFTTSTRLSLGDITLSVNDGTISEQAFASAMQKLGTCVLSGINEEAALQVALQVARKALQPLITTLRACYDPVSDEFSCDLESLGLVRLPRIGRGKHNVHLDPYDSDVHAALADLLTQIGIPALLTRCTGKACSVRETGFSMTSPHFTAPGGAGIAGEGMEWHSDGSAGEYTVLLSLSDVSDDQGTLGVVPGSHLSFVDGSGHGDIADNDYSDCDVRYAYRAGQPIVNDARTIHGVQPNRSDRWRVVTWFILDTY